VPYATLNDIRVHYETYGAGDPLLMISGLGAPAIGWLFQVRDLSPHYHVVTFDNRGVGETDMPPALEYGTGELAEDARALLDHLGIKRAHVMGASMGGAVAMELAIRHPARVRSLTLCGTWAAGDGRFLRVVESWRALAPQLSQEDRLRHVLLPWLYSPAFLADPARVADAVKRTLAYPFPTKAEAMERQARGLLSWNGTRLRDIGKLRVPTMVVVGRDDVLTPPAFSRGLAALLPQARLKLLPGGHAVFIEEAARFNRAVLAFLRAVER
jgi:pimeloyl-ACP methyl ester carboxylesterase